MHAVRSIVRGAALVLGTALLHGCASDVSLSRVGPGWAGNSVNAVVFRKNALVSDGEWQYIAYYDAAGHVVLGKRRLGADAWTLQRSAWRGNVRDAHNAISIMVDGAGVLHMAWNHHDNALHYARGVNPGSLELRAAAMLGRDEDAVSYPEFFRMPDGGLLFLYRDGRSGRGNLVANRYHPDSGWRRVADRLISGEGQRNAYWQAGVDARGAIHLSWVWRASPDVASNHDMAYARSRDGGASWEDSEGRPYALPITAASAEYAARIPPGSDLINQTSMAFDAQDRPYIASYWRTAGSAVPQYRVLYRRAEGWRRLDLDFRKTPFSLSGMGTKAIPIARPQLLLDRHGATASGMLVFRDSERGERVSVVRIADVDAGRWWVADLGEAAVGAWEPTYDTELWRSQGLLHLYLQAVRQIDGEGLADVPPSPVQVLQWQPRR
ncbi:BNR repeat-containing protein [Telluria beijingensis]|uniref:BNR repeat-containing protein n=1 Tax=Telluria beijingensis TaxID=3068633 RepID=UPI00279579D1|nr:BNR repeat-containing protein [Massilia sp. REN29]